MSELYGGHPGVSFVLRGQFKSYDDMVSKGKLGSTYTDVWYNEFAIINPDNKNDRHNGEIYRRGLNYQAKDTQGNDTGGWIYFGKLLGPASGTPYIQLEPMADVQERAKQALTDQEYRRYVSGKDDNGNNVYQIDDNTTARNEDASPYVFSFNHKVDMVPGKTGSGSNIKYNDDITYSWVNIRRDDEDADSWFYVGMKIPYLQIDVDAEATSPYTSGGAYTDVVKVEDTSEKGTDGYRKHPFYQTLHFKIPKGIKGDTIRNLMVIDPGSNEYKNIPIYPYDAFESNSQGTYSLTKTYRDAQTVTAKSYLGRSNDSGKLILVYQLLTYEDAAQGVPYYIYLGEYNMIDNVSLSNDGTFTVNYTHDSNYTTKLLWVRSISVDGTTGDMIRIMNDGTSTVIGNVKSINSVNMADDGSISFTRSDGSSIQLTSGTNGEAAHITYPTDVKLKTGIMDDKRITIVWNYSPNGMLEQSVGNPINDISDMVISKSTYHLYVLFSDPLHRKTTSVSNGVETTINLPSGTLESDWVKESVVYSDSVRNVYWRDFGAVKDQSGVMIGGNVSQTTVDASDYSDIITYLNNTYKDGYEDGKIITYSKGDGEAESKEFYAYDYQRKTWYYLGSISESNTHDVAVGEKTDEINETLNVCGVLFLTETLATKGAMPEYWTPTVS